MGIPFVKIIAYKYHCIEYIYVQIYIKYIPTNSKKCMYIVGTCEYDLFIIALFNLIRWMSV